MKFILWRRLITVPNCSAPLYYYFFFLFTSSLWLQLVIWYAWNSPYNKNLRRFAYQRQKAGNFLINWESFSTSTFLIFRWTAKWKKYIEMTCAYIFGFRLDNGHRLHTQANHFFFFSTLIPITATLVIRKKMNLKKNLIFAPNHWESLDSSFMEICCYSFVNHICIYTKW